MGFSQKTKGGAPPVFFNKAKSTDLPAPEMAREDSDGFTVEVSKAKKAEHDDERWADEDLTEVKPETPATSKRDSVQDEDRWGDEEDDIKPGTRIVSE